MHAVCAFSLFSERDRCCVLEEILVIQGLEVEGGHAASDSIEEKLLANRFLAFGGNHEAIANIGDPVPGLTLAAYSQQCTSSCTTIPILVFMTVCVALSCTFQDGLEVYLPMAGLVDKDKERARLEKQAAKLTKDMEVLEKRLSGSNFVQKVRR